MARDVRVLVVDEDEQLRARLCAAMLERRISCDSAASAEDALRNLSSHRYALVLLHLEIAGAGNVLGLVRLLPARERPIVIVTAELRTQKDDVDTEIVQIVVRRPLRISELAGLIKACLNFVPQSGDVN